MKKLQGWSILNAVRAIGSSRIESAADVIHEMNNINRIVRKMTEQNIRNGLDQYKHEFEQKG